MAFYINQALYIDMYLNGAQLPITLANINSMAIVYNIFDQLPTIRLDVLDNKGMFNNGALTDGSILSVMVGKDVNEAQENVMEFQLVGIPEERKSTQKSSYLIYGVLHCPKLWKCVEPFSFKGTSSQALKQIAINNGLTYSGPITVDDMVWMNGTRTYSDFVDFITDYGYSGPESFMMSAITPTKKLIYKDLNAAKPTQFISNIPLKDKQALLYKEIDIKNKAGINNYFYGYQSKVSQFGIDGSIKESSKIDIVKQNSTNLNVNKNTYNESGLIRNEILPVNLGNFHNYWNQAYYQNKRYKALNSLSSEVYFGFRTPIEVLDKIEVNFINQNTNETRQSQATYWYVGAKTLAISRQEYVEKLLLYSSGNELNLFDNTF